MIDVSKLDDKELMLLKEKIVKEKNKRDNDNAELKYKSKEYKNIGGLVKDFTNKFTCQEFNVEVNIPIKFTAYIEYSLRRKQCIIQNTIVKLNGRVSNITKSNADYIIGVLSDSEYLFEELFRKNIKQLNSLASKECNKIQEEIKKHDFNISDFV